MNPDEQYPSKKLVWIIAGIALVLVVGGLIWYFLLGGKAGGGIKLTSPFGSPSENAIDIPQPNNGGSGGQGGNTSNTGQESMFRQLTERAVAGAYAVQRDGVDYVRYIAKETGNSYEIDMQNGAERQLTNTTIPRIALADWVLDGNAVVLRYLERGELSGREVIKTYLGHISTPSASSSNQVGAMVIDLLPDNIIALSVAPNGKDLFYLIKTTTGVSGSMVNLGTKTTREVFRNTFSEWSPQLFNDGTVILTTKPSWSTLGYSYHYDPKTKSLERLVREKNGLTTLGSLSGSRVLYGENISSRTTLGAYDRSGFSGDEGTIFHEKKLPLETLPEKCAWQKDGIHVLCGSFLSAPSGSIPDQWYQGLLSFNDTFWEINTDTEEIIFLADPKVETGREFDVTEPLISINEAYFIFTNKKDGTLWSMRIPEKVVSDEPETLPSTLSPAELKDAEGSLPTTVKGDTTTKKP